MGTASQSASGAFGIPFRLVGFGFWQAWWMLAMCTDLLLPQRSESGTLFNSFFCITVLTTLGYFVAVLIGRRFGSFSTHRYSYNIAGGLATLGSLGLVAFKTFFYAGTVTPLFFVGAIPFAMGNAMLLIMWGELWSTLATGRVGRSLCLLCLCIRCVFCRGGTPAPGSRDYCLRTTNDSRRRSPGMSRRA